MKLDPKKYPLIAGIVTADNAGAPAPEALAAKPPAGKSSKKPPSLLTAKQIEDYIKDACDDIALEVNKISDLRFELSDLADAGSAEAKKLYDGWTRVAHLYLSEAMEAVGNENAEWHAD